MRPSREISGTPLPDGRGSEGALVRSRDREGAVPCGDCSRRTFLGRGMAGLGGLFTLRSLMGQTRSGLHYPAKAKRVIFLYQAGGPSHLETFDYKPKLAEMHGKG